MNLAIYKNVVSQLQQKKPIQYILKEAHFYGLTFSRKPCSINSKGRD